MSGPSRLAALCQGLQQPLGLEPGVRVNSQVCSVRTRSKRQYFQLLGYNKTNTYFDQRLKVLFSYQGQSLPLGVVTVVANTEGNDSLLNNFYYYFGKYVLRPCPRYLVRCCGCICD